MPKHSGVSRFLQNYADVTIDEFANSKEAKRMRRKNVKEIPLQVDVDVAVDDDDDDDESISMKMMNFKLKPSSDESVSVNHAYNSYPIDLWYLVSSYIDPEDVVSFALICQQTYAITTTMKFWKGMYKRHYNERIEVPVRLQPNCMARPGGVRACTIRSLFFTYTPFVERLLKQPKQDFHLLVKRYVVRYWFSQVTSTKWQYFYKLKRMPMAGSRCAESEKMFQRNARSLKSMRDIYLNSEEGCALLMIESTKFQPLPRLSDEMETANNVTLHSICHLLSRSCNHYRLEMKFAGASRQIVGSITYEPAKEIQVYDWWTPTYAKYVKQGVQPKLEYIRDEKDAPDDGPGMTDDDAWDFVMNRLS